MHTQKNQPLSVHGLEEWRQCAVRQPADKGRARVLHGHVCVRVCVYWRGAEGLELRVGFGRDPGLYVCINAFK